MKVVLHDADTFDPDGADANKLLREPVFDAVELTGEDIWTWYMGVVQRSASLIKSIQDQRFLALSAPDQLTLLRDYSNCLIHRTRMEEQYGTMLQLRERAGV